MEQRALVASPWEQIAYGCGRHWSKIRLSIRQRFCIQFTADYCTAGTFHGSVVASEKMLTTWGHHVIDDPTRGLFTVHRDVFTSPEIFDLEMQHIFERSWVFVAAESQLPEPFDFFSTTIGRQPIVITRNAEGVVQAFLDSCRHKGARLCRVAAGNKKLFVCPYHTWSYDSNGRNVAMKDRREGAYTHEFEEDDHNLIPVARLGIYRGLVFASLHADVPTLDEYLGDTRVLIDLVMDQGQHGMELVPGRTAFTYRGNWKLQAENGMDPYHLTSTHTSFMAIVADRQTRGNDLAAIRSRDFRRTVDAACGVFTFPFGHGAIWIENATPEQKPIYRRIDELRRRVGPLRTEWMLNFRNLVFFPNLQLADSESLLLRVIRPIAVDQTEVRLYCLAPRLEEASTRTLRIRQHEDFFNVSGLATPDDAVIYEDCQNGYRAFSVAHQQGYARGMSVVTEGPNEVARKLGINPVTCAQGSFRLQPEIQYHGFYREWDRLMRRAWRADTREAAE